MRLFRKIRCQFLPPGGGLSTGYVDFYKIPSAKQLIKSEVKANTDLDIISSKIERCSCKAF
jgi:hypothetical protein